MENNNTIQLKGTYNIEIQGIDGKVRDSFTVDNAVVNAGFAQLALLAGDATAIPFTYLELGTSNTAVAVSQTTLVAAITTNSLARALGTVSRVTTTVTNDTMQITYTWTASGTSVIEEIGVFNAASTGTMLSRALTSTKTVVNGEQIIATYKLKFA